MINIGPGFVRGNYYCNKDTYKLNIDLYNTKLILSCLKLTPTPTMVRTRTRSPEEMDGAKEDPAVVAGAIAMTVAETTRLQNIHLKEK